LMAKARQAYHTSAELKAKAEAATRNKGGGKEGLEDRKGGKAGHAKFKCPICQAAVSAERRWGAHTAFCG
jgi:hypothetical protein